MVTATVSYVSYNYCLGMATTLTASNARISAIQTGRSVTSFWELSTGAMSRTESDVPSNETIVAICFSSCVSPHADDMPLDTALCECKESSGRNIMMEFVGQSPTFVVVVLASVDSLAFPDEGWTLYPKGDVSLMLKEPVEASDWREFSLK